MTKKPCVFCAIVRGEADAQVVLDEARCMAFLDARPLFPGHVLVIPKDHVETLTDLPRADLEPIFAATQRCARAVEKALGATGTFVGVNNRVSQSVPHLHVHVVPRRPKDGLRGFFWPRHKYASDAEMKAIAESIRAAV